MSELRRACVCCGSSEGLRPAYRRVAEDLARRIARAGIGVVYGGASVGLMPDLSDAFVALPGAAYEPPLLPKWVEGASA